MDERAEHREEAATWALDWRGVGAIFSHITITVQQVSAWDANVSKVQTAIINTVQTALESVIFPANARKEVSAVITQRNIERMHTMVDTLGD